MHMGMLVHSDGLPMALQVAEKWRRVDRQEPGLDWQGEERMEAQIVGLVKFWYGRPVEGWVGGEIKMQLLWDGERANKLEVHGSRKTS